MSHFEDAKELIGHAGDQLAEIETAYASSLEEKEINARLLIEIKNFMENLRSALDFIAHGLFEKYGSSQAKKPKIYFPYALRDQSRAEFRNAGRMETCIPGLSQSRRDVVDKLESYQHFANPDNMWLPSFMELTNENKHQQLTPQVRKESKELRITSGGAQMKLGPGASVSVGKGASIRIGDMEISGGQSFDSSKPPMTKGSGTKEVITWVSFDFSTNGEPVLPLLKKALESITHIHAELSQL